MAAKKGRGRPAKHEWPVLMQQYIDARIADPAYSLADFAAETGIDYPQIRNHASREEWNVAYMNQRTVLDDRVTAATLERHGAVIERLRRKLIFTEEHLRAKTATFAQTIKTRIEESLLSIDWDKTSLKDRREIYALLHEMESNALGITPAKHTVHHHVNHQAKGPNGQVYLSADSHEEAVQRRLLLAEKFLTVIEGSSTRVVEKKRRTA